MQTTLTLNQNGTHTNMENQPALISEREVLEMQDPAILRQMAFVALTRASELESFVHRVGDVYAGITGQEMNLDDNAVH
jgi:hypothetical protein